MTPTRSLPWIVLVLALALTAVIAHARVVLGGDTWDDVRYHVEVTPPRLAAAELVQGGSLPAWWEGAGLGVPLWGEPSHGAMAPPVWLAATPRALDLVFLLYLVWAGLGVAIWARTRVPPVSVGTSDHAALVVGIIVVTSGLLMTAALRGALPSIAHVPWIGAAATWLVVATRASRAASDDAARARADRQRVVATCSLGALIGMVGLAGDLAVLVDVVVLAVAIALRGPGRYLALAVGAGLAISAAQWIPALLQLGEGTGAVVDGLRLSRLIELIVPGSFGSSDPARAVAAVAGEGAWAPSLFVGAPLLALAAVRAPPVRVVVACGGFVALALVTGRGGWPAWLGAPELHLIVVALVLAPYAAAGVDALVAGQRRARRALAVGAACTAIALVAIAALRAQHPAAAPALDRALLEGALGLLCVVAVLVVAWRASGRELGRVTPIVFALLALPGMGAMPSLAPTASRALVDEAPAWARLAEGVPAPVRVYRPVFLHDRAERLADAMATFGGGSGWRWRVGLANTEDPARLPAHDRVWLAAAREGGALLDRFGISLAILPETLVLPRKLVELGRRGRWALVGLPVAPAAAVLRGWRWATDPQDAVGLLFAAGGGTNVLRGTVVLRGAGEPRSDQGPPLSCAIDRWDPGQIELGCTAPVEAYAVVSSTPAAGWTVTVDGARRPWVTADVLRRAVSVDAGAHAIRWSYATPGGWLGLAIAGLGVLSLVGLALAQRLGARRGADRSP